MTSNPKQSALPSVIWAHLIAIGAFALAAWLDAHHADAYYRAVQEDEFLEWGTFWAFLLAAGWFATAAVRERRAQGGVPWFHAGVAFFCFVVAMEEISWGQRVLGYRPPTYFLANNFQQELNFHNVVDTSLRKLAFKAVLAGYGVALPLLAAWPMVGTRLSRLGVRAPHPALVGPFALAAVVYEVYPWSFTGEWVEMVAGIAFLYVGSLSASALTAATVPPRPVNTWMRAAWPTLLTLLLAGATTAAWRHERQVDPAVSQTARAEIAALLEDFRSGNLASRCGVHRRLFTYMDRNDQTYLRQGRFASLVEQGLPEARAEFLLDPWNSPYWLRHRCEGDQEVAFVYSFGPNRRRDSTRWEILGDDVGAYIYRTASAAAPPDR